MPQYNIAKTIIKSNRFYYGWIILAISSLGYFFSGPGQTYFTSIFIDSYINDFGWNRATVSSLYSIATLMAGLLLFIIGRLSDKYGQKKIVIIVAALLGLSCFWNSFISNLWMLFFGFFVSRLMGQGAMTLLPSTLIPKWFIKKRAFAFSMLSIGVVLGSAIIPPLNAFLISLWNWHVVWRIWGVLLWLIFMPLTYIFLYNKPEDLGIQNNSDITNSNNELHNVLEIKNHSWTLKEAMHTKSFWGMLFCQILLPMITTGIVFHFISILGVKGVSYSSASMLLSLLGIVSFPTTLIAGLLLDRVKINHMAAVISFLQLLALGILLYSTSMTSLICFIIVQSTAMGFQSVCGGIVWPNYYGTKNLGSIRGFIMTATVVASALGPIPFGIAFDTFGSYNQAIILMMLFPFIGIFSALFSTKPKF